MLCKLETKKIDFETLGVKNGVAAAEKVDKRKASDLSSAKSSDLPGSYISYNKFKKPNNSSSALGHWVVKYKKLLNGVKLKFFREKKEETFV